MALWACLLVTGTSVNFYLIYVLVDWLIDWQLPNLSSTSSIIPFDLHIMIITTTVTPDSQDVICELRKFSSSNSVDSSNSKPIWSPLMELVTELEVCDVSVEGQFIILANTIRLWVRIVINEREYFSAVLYDVSSKVSPATVFRLCPTHSHVNTAVMCGFWTTGFGRYTSNHRQFFVSYSLSITTTVWTDSIVIS